MIRIRTLGAIIGLAVLGVSGAAEAQRPNGPSLPPTLSLRQAVDLALRYNPAYRRAVNAHGPAVWGVRNAYASFVPTFTASYGTNYRGSGTQTFLTDTFVQPSATIGSDYFLGLTLDISGRTFTQPGLARAQLRAADAGIDGAAVTVEAAVRRQYLAVLQAEAQVELAELQLRRNEEFLRLATARYEVGRNTLIDVRQAEVARGQAEVDLLRAQQTVLLERLRLFEQMGVPAPTEPRSVALSDSFPVVDLVWDLESLLAEAERRNPEVLALEAETAAARAGERAAKSSWFPSLSLSAGWSGFTQQFTDDAFLVQQARASAATQLRLCRANNLIISDINTRLAPSDQLPLDDCSRFIFSDADAAAIRDQNDVFPFDFQSQPFQARLTVSLPIFNQFRRSLEISQAATRTDDAAETLRERRLRIRTAVSEAYYTLRTAFETIRIQEANRVAADDQLRLATERYRVGSATFFDLLDAQVTARRAEADYINAVYAYHQAVASLEAAVGRPLR